MALAILGYTVVAMVGTWKSGSRYEGLSGFGFLAKLVVVVYGGGLLLNMPGRVEYLINLLSASR